MFHSHEEQDTFVQLWTVRVDMRIKMEEFNASTSIEERCALASDIRIFHGWLNSGYDKSFCPPLPEAIIQA